MAPTSDDDESEYESSGERAALLAELTQFVSEWPAPRVIEALQEGMSPPTDALVAGLLGAEEIAPAVLACIDLAATGVALSEPQGDLLFRGLYLLGAARHTPACPHVLALLRATGDALEDLIGDTDTDGLQRILTGLYDGDAEAFREAVLDAKTGEAACGALLDAIAFLTLEGRITAEWTQALLEDVERAWDRERGELAWYEWSHCIELLGLGALQPLVARAYEDGRIDPAIGTFQEFSEGLAAAVADPGNPDRIALARLGYIEDVVEELRRWEPEPATETGRPPTPLRPYPVRQSDMPLRNPLRHVGRNDPCPCGSGKKYKKCCLE